MLLNVLIGLLVVGITVVIQAYGTNFWLQQFISAQKRLTGEQFKKRTVRILNLFFPAGKATELLVQPGPVLAGTA